MGGGGGGGLGAGRGLSNAAAAIPGPQIHLYESGEAERACQPRYGRHVASGDACHQGFEEPNRGWSGEGAVS